MKVRQLNGDLVHDVELAGPKARPVPPKTVTRAPSRPSPQDLSSSTYLSTPLTLGGELRDSIHRFRALTEHLTSNLEPEVAELVERARAAFDGQVCKVTILGQSQSGKSSLINALTQCDTLLPTGSTPWSAGLTRLHVGHEAASGVRAEFKFFDESEWHRLSEQGGRVRELAERLLPGFDAIRLQSQLADVRQRVRQKLGQKYFELCGQTHAFDTITSEIVARYVGSGNATKGKSGHCEREIKNSPQFGKANRTGRSETVPQSERTEGMYSELIRNADLYLDGNERSIPFTLIDTPGTNDPFLVREEITISATEDADVCLVVLDATRMIDDADVALLRILRSLGRDRIVVFVNKIDQLNDVVKDVNRLHSSLRQVFAQEVPTAQVSFVFGSAKWEQMSRATGKELGGQKGWRDLIAYAASTTDILPNKRTMWERSIAHDEALRQLVLKICSGFPELEATLSWKLCRSRLGAHVHHASSTFATVANNTAGSLETDAAILRRQQDTVQQEQIKREDERQRREVEVTRLKRLVTQLEHQCRRSTDALNANKQDFKNRLEAQLQEEIRAFADHHSASLLQKLRAGEGVRMIVCDPNPLRQRVAEIFVREFRHARRSIMNNQRLTATRLHFLLGQILPDTNVELDFDQLSNTWVYPSLTPLGQTLTFDLGRSWWAQWWHCRKDPEVMAGNLRRLILDEFIPVAAQIVDIAEKDISAEIDTAAWQLALSRNKIAHCIADQKRLLLSQNEKQLGHVDRKTTKQDTSLRLRAIEAQVAECRKLAEQFAALAVRWEQASEAPRREVR